jgi:outer membrane protein assembly factor BamB
MIRYPRNFIPFRGYCTALSCLLAVACSDGAKSGSPVATAGVGGGPVGGTAAVGGGAGTGVAGAGVGGSGVTGRAGAGAGVAGTGTAGVAGMGVAGQPAPAGTGMMGAAGSGEPGPAGAASVTQYHGNAKRDGNFVDAAFTRAAAAMLKKDTTFTATTGGNMYAQPLYFDAGQGGKDLVIAATQSNEVSAFDATTGAMVWKKTIAPPVTSGLPCGNIRPSLGVTGTPVIDPATKTLYVAAMTTGPKHQVFALSLDDGSTKMGWPADISTVTSGSFKFNSAAQNQRGALIIVGDMVYVPYGGHFGDCSDYHGWVVGVPLNNPAAPIGYATSAPAGAGIWAPGGLASDGVSVFAATGNSMSGPGGLFTTPSAFGFGNAILRLGKDLKPVAESDTTNFFAAQDWAALDRGDLDLGGSGPVLITVPGATPSELVVALGKSGAAYLLDRAKLGGLGGELVNKPVAGGTIIQAAAAYTTPTGTFVAFKAQENVTGCPSGSGQLGALKVEAASPPTISVAWCAVSSSNGSPIVTTTDGKAESIVWLLAGGKVLGFNGENGMPVYNGGGASDGTGATASFQTLMVAKGRIFVGTNSGVVAYTLK